MARKPNPDSTDHPDNRAEDGYPLGLPKAIEELTPQEVEAVARRHHIWTRAKMARFLEALIQSCSVSAAARAVGMSRQSAYRLRARLSGQPFDIAWEAALEFGLQQLAHAALDRAMNGVEEAVFHGGEQIGTRTRYDERLTMFLLSNPARIGRRPLKREHMLERWDDLLSFVRQAPPDRETAQAEIAALEQTPEGAARIAAALAGAEEEERAFLATRSHHAARARDDADSRAPRRPSRPKR